MGESSNTQNVDDSYFFSVLSDDQELFPISDEMYAEELQLQEVLMSSFIVSRESSSFPTTNLCIKSSTERGESSSSEASFCKICMELSSPIEMFMNKDCSHVFCRDCLSHYIAAKVQDDITMVKCPELKCKGVLEPQLCQEIVPKEVFEWWETALCDSMILGSQRFYCPFKDCSVLLVDDGGETVKQSVCPNCQRLFCAQCQVPWHSGMECEEFQRLGVDERGQEDLMLMEVAKNREWKRCPSCKYFVEKTEGCMHITCRCWFEFCYKCGLQWNSSHAC